MILNKTIKMAPVILGLATGVYHSTNLVFNEKDVQNNLVNIDFDAVRYIDNLNSFSYESVYMANKIKTLYENWKEETLLSSDIHSITENDNFKQIIMLGEKAIPYILLELKEEPSTLVWSLNKILNRKISNQNLSIAQASKAWVKWGIENKIIEV